MTCKNRMEKFMEACLLMLLYIRDEHGYNLMEQLSHFGFSNEDINISTLYRTLRSMEKRGYVLSNWKQGDQGPQKRVYKITKAGKEELNERIIFFKNRKNRIEKLIDKYERKDI